MDLVTIQLQRAVCENYIILLYLYGETSVHGRFSIANYMSKIRLRASEQWTPYHVCNASRRC